MGTSNIEAFSVALIDAANDKDERVRQQVSQALCELGFHHPKVVLMASHDYLLKHSKLVQVHRVLVLQSMEAMVKHTITQLDQPLARKIITLASGELTRSKEVIPDWQEAASDLLVALGCRFINEVMEEVLQKFQPGILPHFFVVRTLANLSVANVYGMVPFLTAILGTMLPMLGIARQDNMKSIFTIALGQFSEAILEYLANLDKAPDPSVRKDAFSGEIYAAYEVLFNQWLQHKEPKLRTSVVDALGQMSHLMPHDKLEEQLPKLIPGILSLYRKHPEHFHFTQSLCHVLDASVAMVSRVLESQMDGLLNVLHPQICAPVDYRNHTAVKNHNEVLRCFTVLARAFPDRLVMFLLQKLESHSERVRIGTLTVLKHLINSSAPQLESKKPLILSGIKVPLQDTNNKVKWAMVQVISAMAHHNYLELPGGEAMVEFIIRQCALPCSTPTPKPRSYDPDEVTEENLRNMCDNILNLLTTTVRTMEPVLWPFLLEFVTSPQYVNALAPVCRSLEFLGAKKQQNADKDFILHLEERVNLPGPHLLLTRLMVVSSFPYRGRGRGLAALKLLQVLSGSLHPALGKVCDSELASLLHHLTENSEQSLLQRQWEDKLLWFLSQNVEAVSDDLWRSQLCEEMIQHLNVYNSHPQEKGFLYKCVGVVLRHTHSRDTVRKQLLELLQTVRHTEPLEREGVAVGVGFCAATHLDDTLSKLEDFGKSDIVRKTSSLFNILKDKGDVEVEKVRSTLMLCYGYVSLHGPEQLILLRIQTHIVRLVLSHFNTKVLGIKVETKDLTVKLSLLRAVSLIARAIYSNTTNQTFTFSHKGELLHLLQDLIRAEPPDVLRTPIRQHAIKACLHLLKLDPMLSEADMYELITTCLGSVFSLPPPLATEKGKEEAVTDIKEREMMYTDALTALHDLLMQILLQDLSPDGLQAVFKHIEPWLSGRDHERERATETTSKLLAFYLDKLNIRNMVAFHNLGALIGRVIPRCADPLLTVRCGAVESVYTLLCIQRRYEGFALDHRDEEVEFLRSVKDGLGQVDSKVLYRTCSDIGKVISKRMPQDQVNTLLFMLFEGLGDQHLSSAIAASILINTLVHIRGNGLGNQVSEVLEVLHLQLQSVTQEQVKFSVLQTVSLLAAQNMPAVIACLLSHPLPFDREAGELWQALALVLPGEGALARRILEHLVEKLNKQLPYEEKRDSLLRKSITRYSTIPSLAVTCALCEMLSRPELGEIVLSLYPQLLACLLVRVGSSVGVRPPRDLPNTGAKRSGQTRSPRSLDVCSYSVDALKALLARGKAHAVLKAMEDEVGWELIKDPEKHPEGVTVLARAMAQHSVPNLSSVVERLAPTLSSVYEDQRITVTAFYAELLNHHVMADLLLVDALVSSLLRCLVDPCPVVRMLSIRGLGNVAVGAASQIHKYATRLLSALIAGMDEKDDPGDLITLEAMSGLAKVLEVLEDSSVQPILINIALRIRPFFEKDKDRVRAAAFTVFGSLSKFGDGQSKADFLEQIHSSLVSLLLHLNDSSEQVVKACKFALRLIGRLLCSVSVGSMFQKHLLGEASLHYGEFINNLSKHIISDFPEKINFYVMGCMAFFRSIWPEIRANAVMFSGFLLGNLTPNQLQTVSLEHVCAAILMLLQDGSPEVRMKAAEALSLLHGL